METNFTPTRKKNTSTVDIALGFSRIFVGILFLFSGFIKANDPTGFGYKLEEYFLVFQLDFLNDYSVWIAVLICGLEIVLGAFLLLGFYRNKVAWGILLLTVFFLFLTFYSAFFEVVSSCGCFGDAIPLTPWQSFIKDVILLVFVLVIFKYRARIQPILSNQTTRSLVSTLVILLSFGIGVYTIYFLPFIDFLPYKEGNNIPELMVLPDGEEGDIYEHLYEIKHQQTGEVKKVTDKEYMDGIWEDDNWEVVGEPTSKLVKKGYQIPIPDLLISDSEGNDVTQEIITNPYYNFVVVCTYVDKLSLADIIALDRINTTIRDLATDYNLRALLLTTSSPEVARGLQDEMDLVLETFYADAIPLKSMVRSNPGVLLLQNGTVIKKWSKITFPSKRELEEDYLAK
ncbi:BT_3928 family protein [Sphingobacterium gobiense]|uniref:DoxX family protein n=1 Tax=Sphingobacterium gobiense TaxID=1382456 RepID=A0A2S9JW58_9SPHI|nr:BT_3928 family protein [Sphingobacterium gobiense]PRD57518.1 DoxX family protein [Sphingobacterium gobiense]